MLKFNDLRLRDWVTPTRYIEPLRISQWHYADECENVRGPLMPGARLRVARVPMAGTQVTTDSWGTIELVGGNPRMVLRVTEADLGHNFKKVT